MSCSTWQLVEQSKSSFVMPWVANNPPLRIRLSWRLKRLRSGDYHLTANPWNNHYGLSLQLIHQSVSPPLSFPPFVSVFIFIPVWTSHAFVCHVICYLLLLCLFRIWCTVILMKNPENRDVIAEVYQEQHNNGVRRLMRMTGMCADLYRVWLRISKNQTIQYASCRGYDSI